MPTHEEYIKHREYYRTYGIKSRRRIREYYWKNHERLLQRQREYARKHADRIRQAAREHHSSAEFRAKNIIRGKRVRDDRKKWLSEIKKDLRCSVCGQSFADCPIILDFHHKGKESKETAIGYLMRDRRAKKTILAEIAKCIPVCANCHRKLHNSEKQARVKNITRGKRFRKDRKIWLPEMKTTLSCAVCGQSFPDCPSIIDFHHEGSQLKENRISAMIRERRPKEAILREISKCIPVCANCHRRLHYDLRKGGREKEDEMDLELEEFFNLQLHW